MKNFLSFFCLGLAFSGYTTETLKAYYLRKIDLSEKQILREIDLTISQATSNHLVAYAYYLKAVRLRASNRNFEAYEYYDRSYLFLTKAEIPDYFLECGMLTNQGVILKQFGLYKQAIKKYREALTPAFAFSLDLGLSVKYNLGRVLMYENPEEAILVFSEIIEAAKEEGLKDREAKSYYELGQIFLLTEDIPRSIRYFKKAVSIAESDEVKLRALHNLSRPYDDLEEFEKQKQVLLDALAIETEASVRFTSLMDLGECLLELGQKDSARVVLKQAEAQYLTQPLLDANVKVFKWLALANERDFDYAWKRGDELEKIVETKKKLEALLKKQAMLQFLQRLDSEKTVKTTKDFAFYFGALCLVIIMGILISWRIWWNRLRKRLETKIIELGRRWEHKREYID